MLKTNAASNKDWELPEDTAARLGVNHNNVQMVMLAVLMDIRAVLDTIKHQLGVPKPQSYPMPDEQWPPRDQTLQPTVPPAKKVADEARKKK